MAERPLPVIDADTRPFWEACAQHELRIQHCQACGSYIFYPRAVCPNCMSDQLMWEKISGHGRLYSYTIAYRPSEPFFADRVPLVIGLVQLEEGPRMMTNIVNCPFEELQCDLPVHVIFEDTSEGLTLPLFVPDRFEW